MHWAILFGGEKKEELTTLILNKTSEINHVSIAGMTPLHFAAGLNEKSIIRLLIDRGGDLEAKDMSGKRPIDYANEEMTHLFTKTH